MLLGAALSPAPDPRIVLGAVLAFGLAVGIAAHCFDELQGRPLGTRIPAQVLVALGAVGLIGAAALGVAAALLLGPAFGLFVAAGVALVLLYAFEEPLVPRTSVSRSRWGAFTVIKTAYCDQSPPCCPAVAVACAAAVLSLAQRTLSTGSCGAATQRSVRGELIFSDGSRETLDAASY